MPGGGGLIIIKNGSNAEGTYNNFKRLIGGIVEIGKVEIRTKKIEERRKKEGAWISGSGATKSQVGKKSRWRRQVEIRGPGRGRFKPGRGKTARESKKAKKGRK